MTAERRSLYAECLAAAVCLAVLFYVMRAALFLGEGAASHDNLYWLLPIYHYFAGSLLEGSLPLWNPYTHAGEPFYPMLLHLRLMDPSAFVTLAIGRLFTNDLITLANWHLMVLSLISAFGAYLLLRQWCDHLILRLSLIPVLLWSSFLLVNFRQNGMVFQSLTVPFALFFLFRILNGGTEGSGARRWSNWIGLALAVGFSLQSYFFVAVLTAGFLFLIGALLFHRAVVLRILCTRATWLRMAVFGAVVLPMLAPNLVMLLERGDYAVSVREVDFDYVGRQPLQSPPQFEPGPTNVEDDPLVMPFSLIRYTGSFGSPWDFVLALAPEGNREVGDHPWQRSFGYPSEAIFYVSMLVFVIALFGVLAGRHHLKRLWLFLGVSFGLLFLGPAGGLFWLLYQFFPPAWFNRHTHHYIDIVVLALLYFYVIGGNALLAGRKLDSTRFDGLLGRLFGGQNLLAAFWRGALRPRGAPPPAEAPAGLHGRADLIAFLVYFLACVVIGHRLLASSATPAPVDALPAELPWLVLWLLFSWLLARDLGHRGFFLGLLAAQIVLLLGVARNSMAVFFDLSLFLFLPLILCWLLAQRFNWSQARLGCIVVIFICADLMVYLSAAERLWTAPRPDIDARVSAEAEAPRFPEERVTALIPPQDLRPRIASWRQYGQVPRYLEVMARRAAAFTPVMLDAKEDPGYFASRPLPGLSSMDIRPSGGGVGYELEAIDPGATPAELVVAPQSDRPVVVEISLARLPVNPTRRQWLAIWIKSENSVPEAVELALLSDQSRVKREIENIGGWTRLVFELPALGGSQTKLRLSVLPEADAPVRLARLEVSAAAPGTQLTEDDLLFTRVLEGRRWNSSIVPLRFQSLVHADLHAAVKQRLLSIGRPLIEFRPSDAALFADNPLATLAGLSPGKAQALLDTRLLLPSIAAGVRRSEDSSRSPKGEFTAVLAESSANRLVFDVEAPQAGYLYIANAHHTGWQARVDGEERPVFLANGLFKAVPLAAGSQQVVLSFRPTGFIAACVVFWAVPLLALLFLAYVAWRDTRAGAVAS